MGMMRKDNYVVDLDLKGLGEGAYGASMIFHVA
jgi:hypothetical protein